MGLNLGSIGKKIEDILGAGVGAVGHEIGQLPNQILHLGAPAPAPAPPVAAPQPMQIPRSLGPQALGLSPTLYNPNNMPQSLVLPPPAPAKKTQARQGVLGQINKATDFSPNPNYQSPNDYSHPSNPIQGTLAALQAKPAIGYSPAGLPVGILKAAVDYALDPERQAHPGSLKSFQKFASGVGESGLQNTGISSAGHLFGSGVSSIPLRPGDNNDPYNVPLFGAQQSLQGQVRDNGLGGTALNAATDVTGATLGALGVDPELVPQIAKEARKVPGQVTEAYKASPLSSETGSVAIDPTESIRAGNKKALDAATEAIQRQNEITDFKKSPANETTNKISLVAKDGKAAIGETEGIVTEAVKRYNDTVAEGAKLSPSDLSKLSDAINGENVGRVENPKLFNRVVSQAQDAGDYALSGVRAGGGETLRFNQGKWAPLYFKTSVEAMDKLGIPEDQRFQLGDGTTGFSDGQPHLAGEGGGYHNAPRKYTSYTDAAEKTGGVLQPLNANPLDDLRQYTQGLQPTLRQSILYNQLKRLYPDEISNDRNVTKLGGNDLVPAAKGNLPFNVSNRLNKLLTGYKSATLDNPLAEGAFKGVEAATSTSRKVSFAASPIHFANLAWNYAGETVGSGHPIQAINGVARAGLSALSDRAYRVEENAADQVGVREFNRQLGVVEKPTTPDYIGKGTSVAGTADKFSPFNVTMRSMNRFSNTLSWRLGSLAEKAGVEPGTADGAAVGGEINKVLDTLNPKMEGLNPVVQRAAGSGSIAPNWIRSQIGLVTDAFDPRKGAKTILGNGNAGDIARSAVIGKRAIEASAAIIASAVATGQMPTFHKALSQAGLLPSNFSPNIQGGSVNAKTGKPVVTNLPTDQIGLIASLLTDPQHFATARETPVLSGITQAITNKDFFGNPLVDKTQPGWRVKLAEKAASSLLPFSVQNASNPNLSPGQQIEGAFGMRTHRDKTDPNYIAANNYYSASNAALSQARNDTEKAALLEWLGSKRDPITGGYAVSPTVEDSPAKATTLLQSPRVIGILAQMNQKLASQGQSIDPLWAQSPDKIKAYLQYQTINKNNTQQLTDWAQKNPWYQDMEQARSVFFNSLPPGDPNKPAAPIAPVVQTAGVQKAFSQYDGLTDPTQKAQFLGAHPELTDAMAQAADRTNKVLVAQGLTPLKPYPVADANTASYTSAYMNGTKEQRAALRSGNPLGYQAMSAYLQNINEYEVAKNGALDQLQGQVPNQKLLKGISSLAQYDMVKNPDGTLALKYGTVNPGATTYGSVAAPPQAGAVSAVTSGGSVSGGKSSAQASFERRELRNAGKSIRRRAPRVKVRSHSQSLLVNRAKPKKAFVAFYPTAGKRTFKHTTPKVSLKPSR